MEIAVANAGHGPMPASERWLLAGSVAFVMLCLALIQTASITDSPLQDQIVVSRLAGVPFLLVIGLLSGLEAQWVALGVLAVCVAEVIADLSGPTESIEAEPEIPID
jgi:hypothetical protein